MKKRTPADAYQQGTAIRKQLPRSAHADWTPAPDRRDPVSILIGQGENRLQDLLPLRYARMQTDPFAFLRGAAAVMAADLGAMPHTDLRVQTCGDCHLANFGAYASPEGIPVFDCNDFDETLPAPFEWDLKRLATSLVVAGRVGGLSNRDCRRLALLAVEQYRERMTMLAALPPIEAWSARIDLAAAVRHIDNGDLRHRIEARMDKVLESGSNHFNLVERTPSGWRIREKPPLVRHIDKNELRARRAFKSYAETLQEDRRVLLSRYKLEDVAFKIVGVGSVGTFCALGLLVSRDGSPLLLQIKEAQQSVLAPYAGPSDYANQGERVVTGQRMMQAATDIFLGWTLKPLDGREFYIRRLKDSRLANVGAMIQESLPFYAGLCGQTLARGHARSGDAAALAGYMGAGDAFDDAIADFADAYADQTEHDWQSFKDAIALRRIVTSDTLGT